MASSSHPPAAWRAVALALAAALAGAPLAAQHPGMRHDSAGHRASSGRGAADTGFAALQARGKSVMGVDQSTSTHRFDALPDGGRIELRRDVADSEGVATIRRHLREIAAAFAAGDFDAPGLVHAKEVPGTAIMAARRKAIRYEVRDLPSGAELRMITADAGARRAIHEFMAFQRREHHAGGEDGGHAH
ncbi:MAG TPA: hypothetical protein VFK09_10615 [Gemmatimonadales bacterium]|nr:hypothetical protein [Gemmatimonadales bacterium]